MKRSLCVTTVMAMFVVGALGVPAAPAHGASVAYQEAMKALKEAEQSGDIAQAYAGTNKAAATRVRKAFLKAKKAFHQARKDIQAIKKGDEEPKDVPGFFSDEERDDADDEEYEEEDGSYVTAG